MNPLVSIIVPVYNVQDYVLNCLKSLAKQDYEQIEIIVVDDGSTDKSGKLCDKFAKNDKRIKVFHKKNGGLSSARNYGIKKANGNYICLVDSDDSVKQGFVEEMVNAALKHSAEIVTCGFNNQIPEKQTLTGKEATIKLLLEQENIDIIAWNKIYKKELFNNILYPEGFNYEDSLTTYKLLSKAKKVVYLTKSLYNYTERPKSITNSNKKEEKLKFRELAAKEAFDYFANQKDIQQAAEIAILTAKFAFIDFAVNKTIEKKYINYGKEWIKNNKEKLLSNKYLSKKLRTYIFLLTHFNGKLYITFRGIRHE